MLIQWQFAASSNVLCLVVTLFDINKVIPAFFWLLACCLFLSLSQSYYTVFEARISWRSDWDMLLIFASIFVFTDIFRPFMSNVITSVRDELATLSFLFCLCMSFIFFILLSCGLFDYFWKLHLDLFSIFMPLHSSLCGFFKCTLYIHNLSWVSSVYLLLLTTNLNISSTYL